MTTAQARTQTFAPANAALNIADWKILNGNTVAQHASGLVIQFEVKQKSRSTRPAIDIQGLAKLNGTAWAPKANLLIEQGIALLTQQSTSA